MALGAKGRVGSGPGSSATWAWDPGSSLACLHVGLVSLIVVKLKKRQVGRRPLQLERKVGKAG